MNKRQIKSSTNQMIVNRYKWLVTQLDKYNPILTAHENGTATIENPHKAKQLRKNVDRIHDEMELIEAEFKKRREAGIIDHTMFNQVFQVQPPGQ